MGDQDGRRLLSVFQAVMHRWLYHSVKLLPGPPEPGKHLPFTSAYLSVTVFSVFYKGNR